MLTDCYSTHYQIFLTFRQGMPEKIYDFCFTRPFVVPRRKQLGISTILLLRHAVLT
jgi:hypothetical protein